MKFPHTAPRLGSGIPVLFPVLCLSLFLVFLGLISSCVTSMDSAGVYQVIFPEPGQSAERSELPRPAQGFFQDLLQTPYRSLANHWVHVDTRYKLSAGTFREHGYMLDAFILSAPEPRLSGMPESNRPTDYHRLRFTLDLQGVDPGGRVFLDFYSGILQGWRTKGFTWAVFVNDDRVFIHSQDNRAMEHPGWQYHLVELTSWVGQKIDLDLGVVSLFDAMYNEALIGQPRVIGLSERGIIEFSNNRAPFQNAPVPHTPLLRAHAESSLTLEIPPGSISTGIFQVQGISQGRVYSQLVRDDGIEIHSVQIDQTNNQFRISAFLPQGGKHGWTMVIGSEQGVEIQKLSHSFALGNPGIDSLIPATHFVQAGKPGYLLVTLSNPALGDVLPRDGYTLRIFLDKQEMTLPVVLTSQQTRTLSVPFVPPRAGESKNGDYQNGEFKVTVHIEHGERVLASQSKDILVFQEQEIDSGLILESSVLRLEMITRLEGGEPRVFGARFFGRSAQVTGSGEGLGSWDLLGTLPLPGIPYGTIIAKEQQSIELTFESPESTISVQWSMQDNVLQARHGIKAKKNMEVTHFSGPVLHGGEGSWGRSKSSAIFPGLEFLEENEPSNSADFIAYGYHNRYAPHPYTITVPAMVLTQDPHTLIFSWDPRQPWYGNYEFPGVRFESPALNGQQFSSMGLFAPSVLHNSLVLEKGEEITLSASIEYVHTPGGSAQDGLGNFVARLELPPVPRLRYANEELFNLIMEGMNRELDYRSGKGLSLFGGQPVILYAWLHNLQAIKDVSSGHTRQAAQDLLEGFFQSEETFPQPEQVIWDQTDYWLFRQEEDQLDRYYSEILRRARAYMNEETWVYGETNQFGRRGDQESGTVLMPAVFLIKAAKLTGQQQFWDKGMEALRLIHSFPVQRGIGTWELHIRNPELLASIIALYAALEAYEFRPSPELLSMAVDFANSCLPYLYLYPIPPLLGHPEGMQTTYTSIASFGATNWITLWPGRPVQWEGAIASLLFKRLAGFDDSLDWEFIGQGLSAASSNLINDQDIPARSVHDYPRFAGRFPDVIELVNTNPIEYDIWPDTVLFSLLYDQGHRGRWTVKESGNVRIIAGAEIGTISESADGNGGRMARFSLGSWAQGTVYFLVQLEPGRELKDVILHDPAYEKSLAGYDQSVSLTQKSTGWRPSMHPNQYLVKIRMPGNQGMASEVEIQLGFY